MILVLYEKDLITETFSIKFKVILPPPPRFLFIICVIVYTLYYCCYSKTSSSAVQNVTVKCTETLLPPPSIQYLLERISSLYIL